MDLDDLPDGHFMRLNRDGSFTRLENVRGKVKQVPSHATCCVMYRPKKFIHSDMVIHYYFTDLAACKLFARKEDRIKKYKEYDCFIFKLT